MYGKVATFIDFENVRIRLDSLKPSVDIDKIDFMTKLKNSLKEINIEESTYYIYDDLENKYFSQNNILSRYTAMGFVVNNVLCAKDSADIQLCLDAFELAIKEDVETFIIISSDRDMFPLIRKLKLNHKKVIVCGLTFNASNHIIKYVDKYIPIEEIIGTSYDEHYIIKKDIIDATKRLKDLNDWASKKGCGLGKKTFMEKLSAKLYETNEYTKKIYDILINNSILEEYDYNVKGHPAIGVKFISNKQSEDIVKEKIPTFHE